VWTQQGRAKRGFLDGGAEEHGFDGLAAARTRRLCLVEGAAVFEDKTSGTLSTGEEVAAAGEDDVAALFEAERAE